ncbi:MAG: MBL fold metallo-hydrolase [Planctomycetaceae bacterium]|nr:MBL fold metallo-hydrolase [Planctomycetaceae bacterium]
MNKKIAAVFGWTVILSACHQGFAAEPSKTIRVLYDNYVFDEACGSDWGFACLISGTEKTILFDTGAKGDLLLANFEKMKLRPADVELVVISHNHGDHTGGLLPFLAKNEHVAVYLPAATPESFVKEVKAHGVSVVTKPVEICKGVFVIGPLGDKIVEQSLVVDTRKGLVIITGCSHPGIVEIAKAAKEHLGREIFMVLGGTHLLNHSDADLQRVVDDIKGLGVQKVGATHCSGEKAIVKMKEAFGEGFVTMGVGRVVEVRE